METNSAGSENFVWNTHELIQSETTLGLMTQVKDHLSTTWVCCTDHRCERKRERGLIALCSEWVSDFQVVFLQPNPEHTIILEMENV